MYVCINHIVQEILPIKTIYKWNAKYILLKSEEKFYSFVPNFFQIFIKKKLIEKIWITWIIHNVCEYLTFFYLIKNVLFSNFHTNFVYIIYIWNSFLLGRFIILWLTSFIAVGLLAWVPIKSIYVPFIVKLDGTCLSHNKKNFLMG